jgi:hypothetical protein
LQLEGRLFMPSSTSLGSGSIFQQLLQKKNITMILLYNITPYISCLCPTHEASANNHGQQKEVDRPSLGIKRHAGGKQIPGRVSLVFPFASLNQLFRLTFPSC